jgi:hypothetical protein
MSMADSTSKRPARRVPLDGGADAKRRAGRNYQPIQLSEEELEKEQQRNNRNEVFQEGHFMYTYISAHRLVLNVDCHIRMLEDDNLDLETRATETRSIIEPFQIPLPLPPNCRLYQKHRDRLTTRNSLKYGVRRMGEPITIDDGVVRISIGRPPKDSSKLLDPPNATPYNAYNLRFNSMGYLYEDVWKLDETRPLIAKALLFEDYKKLERERQKRQQEEQTQIVEEKKEEEVNASSPRSSEESEKQQRAQEKRSQEEKEKAEMALDLNDKITSGDIDRSTWCTKVLTKFPAIKEIKERVYPLWRAVTFGHLYDVGRKEVKDTLSHEILVNVILQHLTFERLNRSKKALEEESRLEYKFIDVDQSLLHALLKEAVMKSERFYDLTIGDKFPPKWLQKNRSAVVKEMDEMLADFGTLISLIGLTIFRTRRRCCSKYQSYQR